MRLIRSAGPKEPDSASMRRKHLEFRIHGRAAARHAVQLFDTSSLSRRLPCINVLRRAKRPNSPGSLSLRLCLRTLAARARFQSRRSKEVAVSTHSLAFRMSIGTVVLAFLCMANLAASADNRETCYRDYQPSSGQAGKDVVWVPTNDALVMRMLKMADVKPTDLVYDLGAGDGKIAIAAAKHFGARAVGIEYNPEMVKLAQCLTKVEGVEGRAQIRQGDIFETDFSSATVVTLYLLPELNLRLRPTLLDMKPGTRVVSHSFLMDDWEP